MASVDAVLPPEAPGHSALATEGLGFRVESAADLPFLQALYASTREDELRATDWSAEQKSAFLQMQFGLQHRYYREHFPTAEFSIVLMGAEAIGRLYALRHADAITLIDMALMPHWRGRGIGTTLLDRVLVEARRGNRAVQLHVEFSNPAGRLYERAGFSEVSHNDVYRKLHWQPFPPTPSQQATHP